MQRSELPLKITHHSSKFLPLWHQIPKGLVILSRQWRRVEWRSGTELWLWSWSWVVVIKMIPEISKSCVQSVEVVLKLGLLIIDLLVLLWSGQLRKYIIQSTEVILKVCLHIIQPCHHGLMHSVIDMMTKSVHTSVKLLLKTLLHSLKCIIHLLPICLKMGVEPGLHLL
jgi:hypothetical protein